MPEPSRTALLELPWQGTSPAALVDILAAMMADEEQSKAFRAACAKARECALPRNSNLAATIPYEQRNKFNGGRPRELRALKRIKNIKENYEN